MPRTTGLVQRAAKSNGLLRAAHERIVLLSVARHYTKYFFARTLQTHSHLQADLLSLDGKLDFLLEDLRDVLIGRHLLLGYVGRQFNRRRTRSKHPAIRPDALRLT